MDASNISLDFLMQYKLISSKIKKRFLRKPNIAEASEDFTKLARRLTDCEAWPQAGLCCLAAARCEQSLSSSTTEAKSMIEAAQNFIKTECVNQQLLCHSYDEHLISAITCYEYTMNIYKDEGKPVLAASLALDLSEVLCSLGKHSEEMTYLRAAESFLSTSSIDLLTCWSMMASCKIELGDLDGALTLFTKIISTIKNSKQDYLTGSIKEIYTRCEICSLLLLLILQPLPQHMKTDQAQLLEKYSSPTNYVNSNVPFEDDEMVILLQSLIIACQSKDLDSITDLTLDLSSKLSGQPLHLLYVLEIEMHRS